MNNKVTAMSTAECKVGVSDN